MFPDAGCKREIQDLHVKCPIVDCSWTGELRAVEGSIVLTFFVRSSEEWRIVPFPMGCATHFVWHENVPFISSRKISIPDSSNQLSHNKLIINIGF